MEEAWREGRISEYTYKRVKEEWKEYEEVKKNLGR
jgi:urocanate hydratase